MIGEILQPTHLIFILIAALLLLGPKRLPTAGRALGQSLREFKHSLTGERNDRDTPTTTQTPETNTPNHHDNPTPPDTQTLNHT
jgi:sec-independent protein translocase protein TatA